MEGVAVIVEEVWAATGSACDVLGDPVLRRLHQELPTRVVGGYPVLDDDTLAWPGLAMHLLGRSASLCLGPAAGAGARLLTCRCDDSPPGRWRAVPGSVWFHVMSCHVM